MKVKEIMTKEVVSINPETTVEKIAQIIFKHKITGLPVVDSDKHVVGIVTEYDLLSRESHIHIPSYIQFLNDFQADKNNRAKEEVERVRNLYAEDIMSVPVVTLNLETEVVEAARIFYQDHINPLPVVDGGGVLVGIVSRSDIVKLFAFKA